MNVMWWALFGVLIIIALPMGILFIAKYLIEREKQK